MDEQTATDSPEERLSALFSQPEEAPAQQADAPQAEPEAEVEPEQEDQQEAQAEGEDFEVDGEVFKLPTKLAQHVKELKDGYTRRDDYTRKTQELAAISRQVSAIAETAQANEAVEKELAPQREELAYIKHQLDQYKKVDWINLDATQHLQLRAQMEQLKDRANELQGDIKEKSEGLKAFRERKRQEVIAEGQKYLQQTIKGWGPDSVKEATSVAKEAGYSDEEIGGILDARFVRVLWEAAQYRKGQAQKPNALAAVQKAPPVVKPGALSNPAASRNKQLAQAHKKSGTVESAAALLKQYLR